MLTAVSSQLYQFCKKLIIYNRSLTGDGTKRTLYEIKKNLKELKEKVIAGFNITCVGGERTYSYLPSRNGNFAFSQW